MAKNIAETAKKYKESSFVLISADKAGKPTNVKGKIRSIARILVTDLNKDDLTNFNAVRFGNILECRGYYRSAFCRTNCTWATRYFTTILEASRLVLKTSTLTEASKIFVLHMGNPLKF